MKMPVWSKKWFIAPFVWYGWFILILLVWIAYSLVCMFCFGLVVTVGKIAWEIIWHVISIYPISSVAVFTTLCLTVTLVAIMQGDSNNKKYEAENPQEETMTKEKISAECILMIKALEVVLENIIKKFHESEVDLNTVHLEINRQMSDAKIHYAWGSEYDRADWNIERSVCGHTLRACLASPAEGRSFWCMIIDIE